MFDYIAYCKERVHCVNDVRNIDELPLIDAILFYFIYNTLHVDGFVYDDFISVCSIEYINSNINNWYGFHLKNDSQKRINGVSLILDSWKIRTLLNWILVGSSQLTEKQKMMIKLKFGVIV